MAGDVVQNVINAISLGSLYAVLALGLAIVFSILGLINFAYGELVTITGYSVFFLAAAGMPLWVAAPAAVLIAAVASILMERVAFRPVRRANPIILLITSFAVSAILQNSASLFISPRPRGLPVPAGLTRVLNVGDIRIPPLEAATAVIALLLLGLLTLFLRRTTVGMQLRAAAEDFQMARLLGVRANLVVTSAFAVSGLLAGTAGLLWLARTANVSPTAGFSPVLIAFVAAVIGGLGSLPGAVLGGFILGGLTVGLQAVLPAAALSFRDAFAFGVVIVILLFRPQGLLAPRKAESL